MPLPQSFQYLRKKLSRRVELARVLRRGQRRFVGDSRYRLDGVDRGILPRAIDERADRLLLSRICDAWSKSMDDQAAQPCTFRSHKWWTLVRQKNLAPVMAALSARDYNALGSMYRNFFRDPCSAGVSGAPFGSRVAISAMDATTKHLQLIDALHRIDLWESKTQRCYELSDLETPDIGNPLGTVIEDAFIRTGCEDQHYCARKIIELIGGLDAPVITEIGGGFGGLAYYLMRDHPALTYIGFDLPETIALASYYLLSAFPEVEATLYGERDLAEQTIRTSRIILMPSFEMPRMLTGRADLTFNARLLFDLPRTALNHYLSEIARTTRYHWFHLDRKEPSAEAHAWLQRNAPEFELTECRPSNWNDARTLSPNETESLYTRRVLREPPFEPDLPAC
jgi:putative sugar O-methyltransferase